MILDKLADATRRRVEALKAQTPPEELKSRALAMDRGAFPFEAALRAPDIAVICEVKRASPSKGVIAGEFPYLDIARDYEKAGADAVSVLTEPDYFLGHPDYLSGIRAQVGLPLLRKDFILDDCQLYESKLIGADAVLLICALLDTETLKSYIGICDSLGLSALVEAHDAPEIRSALAAGARIVGVNNRDLRTFQVDLGNSVRLRPLVPGDILFVAESGIKTAEDVGLLRRAGVNAVLIGETLMRSGDKKAALRELRGMA
ncbi:indole-3-glycerol phosphate synthase [Sporobacter termitidis DSM 10068]|uniref:Indole-3-glycerol phosphate synthase n=1 Tax=Sporobacter termitidis DSM 10068 TaxID=1123282 RepID=A0A1M5ZB66_9FIRM|nr:indole-3-glycerol phosphate synthase TrpC [Sporobacter termitidis]SHI21465.1 indole-3-glycerol phosphate synthase [Sporobacter termitidis DSM 10068]